jgi:S1-C subfamily serine protease
LRGEVIGINSAIFSTTGQFAGVGFAVPSDTVAKVVPTLITTGSFNHPWLGVSGKDMTPEVAQALGLDEPRGFLVVDVVSGSPAERAGIQGGDNESVIGGRPVKLGGDVIIGIDDKPVRKIDDILVYLQREKSVGDDIELNILRDGKAQDIIAVLGARPHLQESP